jgi:hypothetical protein
MATVIDSAEVDRLQGIGRAIDQVMTLEMRLSAHSRGIISGLYKAACDAQDGGPLSLRAAEALRAAIAPGDVVLLTTGAGSPEVLPYGETDGPPGIAALAAALSCGLGAVPLLLTESAYVETVERTALAAGLGPRDPEVAMRIGGTTAVLPLSPGESGAKQAREYMDRFQPKAVIAVEKAGPNAAGVTHMASGVAVDPAKGRAEVLFDLARERHVLTIGIGDNGNEIGFGLIEPYVRTNRLYGNTCRCPCGTGIATRVATDILIPANTSNWGANAIVAALAAVLGQVGLVHTPETEKRMIEASVASGAADGSTGRHLPLIDGIPLDVQLAVMTMMQAIVRIGLAPPPSRAIATGARS